MVVVVGSRVCVAPGCRGCLLALQHAGLSVADNANSLTRPARPLVPPPPPPLPRPYQKSIEARDNAWVESEMRQRIKDTAELL